MCWCFCEFFGASNSKCSVYAFLFFVDILMPGLQSINFHASYTYPQLQCCEFAMQSCTSKIKNISCVWAHYVTVCMPYAYCITKWANRPPASWSHLPVTPPQLQQSEASTVVRWLLQWLLCWVAAEHTRMEGRPSWLDVFGNSPCRIASMSSEQMVHHHQLDHTNFLKKATAMIALILILEI